MKYIYNQLLCDTYLSKWWTVTAEHLSGIDVSFIADKPTPEVLKSIMSSPYSIG